MISPVYRDIIDCLLVNPQVSMIVYESYEPGTYRSPRTIYHVPTDQHPTYGSADRSVPPYPVNWPGDRVLGLASVVTNNFNLHLPMFDFDHEDISGPLDTLLGRGYSDDQNLGPVWVIESSPGKRHLICSKLLAWPDYYLLLQSLVGLDPKYVEKSQQRHYGTVRITTGPGKLYLPQLIEVVS